MTLAENWGATAAECALSFDCDRLLARAPIRLHRAVSIAAPAPLVFRWLCQLKLAPYSYDLIDNFARTSPRELTPGAERLEVGQRFMSIFSLVSFAAAEQITLRARSTAVTYAVIAPSAERSRLLVRVLFAPGGPALLAAPLRRALALGDLVMMRKQLLTLKALSERDARREA
jgi:hypothetical protein